MAAEILFEADIRTKEQVRAALDADILGALGVSNDVIGSLRAWVQRGTAFQPQQALAPQVNDVHAYAMPRAPAQPAYQMVPNNNDLYQMAPVTNFVPPENNLYTHPQVLRTTNNNNSQAQLPYQMPQPGNVYNMQPAQMRPMANDVPVNPSAMRDPKVLECLAAADAAIKRCGQANGLLSNLFLCIRAIINDIQAAQACIDLCIGLAPRLLGVVQTLVDVIEVHARLGPALDSQLAMLLEELEQTQQLVKTYRTRPSLHQICKIPAIDHAACFLQAQQSMCNILCNLAFALKSATAEPAIAAQSQVIIQNALAQLPDPIPADPQDRVVLRAMVTASDGREGVTVDTFLADQSLCGRLASILGMQIDEVRVQLSECAQDRAMVIRININLANIWASRQPGIHNLIEHPTVRLLWLKFLGKRENDSQRENVGQREDVGQRENVDFETFLDALQQFLNVYEAMSKEDARAAVHQMSAGLRELLEAEQVVRIGVVAQRLNVEQDLLLSSLLQAVRRNADRALAQSMKQILPPLLPLIGRENELKNLHELATGPGDRRLVWVQGYKDTGKSALVTSLSHALIEKNLVVFYVSVHGLDVVSAETAVLNVVNPGRNLAIRTGLAGWAASVRRPLYIVIDNLDEKQDRPLQARDVDWLVNALSTSITVIVTSRSPPPEGVAVRLLNVGLLEEGDAVRLFEMFGQPQCDDNIIRMVRDSGVPGDIIQLASMPSDEAYAHHSDKLLQQLAALSVFTAPFDREAALYVLGNHKPHQAADAYTEGILDSLIKYQHVRWTGNAMLELTLPDAVALRNAPRPTRRYEEFFVSKLCAAAHAFVNMGTLGINPSIQLVDRYRAHLDRVMFDLELHADIVVQLIHGVVQASSMLFIRWTPEQIETFSHRLVTVLEGKREPDSRLLYIWSSAMSNPEAAEQMLKDDPSSNTPVHKAVSMTVRRWLVHVYARDRRLKELNEVTNEEYRNLSLARDTDELQHAAARHDLGSACIIKRNYQRAIDFLDRAHLARQSRLSECHPDTVDSLLQLGVAFLKSRDDTGAETSFQTCIKNTKLVYGEDHIRIAHMYQYMGQLRLRQKDAKASHAFLMQALKIALEKDVENSWMASEIFENFGALYLEFRDLNQAMNAYNNSIEQLKKAKGLPKARWWNAYHGLGVCFKQLALKSAPNNQAELQSAEFNFGEALKTVLPTDPHAWTTRQMLIDLYENVDRVDDALYQAQALLENLSEGDPDAVRPILLKMTIFFEHHQLHPKQLEAANMLLQLSQSDPLALVQALYRVALALYSARDFAASSEKINDAMAAWFGVDQTQQAPEQQLLTDIQNLAQRLRQ